MSDLGRPDLLPGRSRAVSQFFLQQRQYVVTIAVLVIGLFVAAGALSRSFLIGRLEYPITHNDVNYIIDGIDRVLYMQVNGFWAELHHLYNVPMHAPFEAYLASLGFYLFGFHDWAPYLACTILVWILLATCARLLRGYPNVVVIGALLMVAGMRISLTTIDEFSPEMPLGLFAALGVLIFIPISTLDRAWAQRALAGLCFGLGCVAKPSSFIFVPLVVLACLGVTFIRDILLSGMWRRWQAWRTAILHGIAQLALSLWLPGLWIGPNFTEYKNYFMLALFDTANVKAFGYLIGFKTNALYYLTGYAGEYMFGNFLWVYAILIAVGLAAACWRSDRAYINRQITLFVVVLFMWLLPTVSTAKNALFGAPFSFVLVFMMVMALGSIYELLRGVRGSVVVGGLGAFFLVSGNSILAYSNMPAQEWQVAGSHVLQKMWPKTQDRLRALMLGNAPNYYDQSVYMTNSGYFFTPVLRYWFLKQDPSLDWRFASFWADSDPKVHLDYMRQNKSDFVIAGERGNGLTYGPSMTEGASASEDYLLSAMWQNPDYMVIDRFYGPTGRTITVFQRSVAFAGWSLLGGLGQSGGSARPWISNDVVSHVDSYAPDPIAGKLDFQAAGAPGETIEVVVNGTRLGELMLTADGSGSFARTLKLERGDNDIIFRYSTSAPVSFSRLIVSRQIDRDQ